MPTDNQEAKNMHQTAPFSASAWRPWKANHAPQHIAATPGCEARRPSPMARFREDAPPRIRPL